MLKFDKNYTVSPQGTLFVRKFLLKNGERTECEIMRRSAVAVVCSGECDILVQGMPFRLTKGGWVNIPGGREVTVRVYRSTEPVMVLLFCSKNGTEGTGKVISGNVYDLLQMPGTPPCAVFGQESRCILGCAYRLPAGEMWQTEIHGEKGIVILSDGTYTDGKGVEHRGTSGKVFWAEGGTEFCIAGAAGSEVMLVEAATDMAKAEEYAAWLKEENGILWEQGGVELSAVNEK